MKILQKQSVKRKFSVFRLHATFFQRVEQCVNSVLMGYRTLCLHEYTLTLETMIMKRSSN